jgi:hypothetical protein
MQRSTRVSTSRASCVLVADGQPYTVEILDVSATGAQVEVPPKLPLARSQQVVLGGRKARVVRLEGRLVGLNFKREMPPRVFACKCTHGGWETLF